MIVLFASCVGENTSDISPNQDPTVNPDFDGIGLNILTPVENAKVLDKVVVGGYCSNKDYLVKVTNNHDTKVVYSICQANFTWAAAVNTSSVPAGAYSISAQIFDQTYTTSSPLETITLEKGADLCSSENQAKLFANFESGGNGTSVPYIICNSDQFLNMRFYPTSKFELGRNIDFSNRLIAPILVPFKGEIDGRGFEVSNFIVKELAGTAISVGIFKYVHNAVFKNINFRNALVEGYQRVGIIAGDWRGTGLLENVKIQGKVSGVSYIGGIAGLGNTNSNLVFRNLTTEIEVSGNQYVGGLISFIGSTGGNFLLEDSTVMTKVSGDTLVGGVIGKSLEQNITIQNSTHIGNVHANGKWVGGFVGEYKGGQFFTAKNIGNVSSDLDAENAFVGGFVGETRGATVVTDSESISNISAGGHYVGGFFGRTHITNITNSTARGSITILDDQFDSVARLIGGFAGVVGLNSNISDSQSFVNIDAKAQYVGGIAGVLDGPTTTVSNSYYRGTIDAHTSNVGGIAGVFYGDSIDTSFSEGTINVHNPTPFTFVGGLVGHTKKDASTYSRLHSKMNINIVNGTADYIGGLFGYMIGTSVDESYYIGTIQGFRSKAGGIAGLSKANISKSYSMATINGSLRFIGGITGVSQDSNITDSFSLSNVYGKGEVGGLAGWLEGTDSIERSYFVGSINKVEGTTFPDATFGQIAGLTDATASITNSYFLDSNDMIDHNSAAFSGNTDGEALSNSQLRNPIYYINYAFDSSNWTNPETGFKLPLLAADYLYASHTWLRDPNQGFRIPTVFTSDPLLRNYPSIFIKYDDSLGGLNQDHLAAAESLDPATTVTAGNLELTVLEPSTNTQVVTGQTLIYGECGQPGNPIVIGGDFYISTVCQDNNRWAAVLDVSAFPVGTINFTVSMKSLDYSQSSTVVNKAIVKADDLCNQSEADAGTFANSYLGADGDATPYKICHAGHFANIAYFPDKNFEIVNDIDFGGNTIEPIKSIFRGSINGNNHTLKNYAIKKSTSVNVGLFSIINNATIENLKIENASVIGYERVGLLSGSWVGQGTISNLDVKGSINGIRYTGGLFGLANSGVDLNITDSNFEVDVQGNNFTGGVLGYVSTLGGNLVARNLVLKNTIQGLNYVGGFIGSNVDPSFTLENVTQTGSITGRQSHVGGIAGHVRGGNFDNITVNGNINSTYMAKEANVGGLFGKVELTSFDLNTASYTGTITAGGDHIGGVVGRIQRGTLTNVQSHGNINVLDTRYNSIRYYLGGLIGIATENTSLLNSFSDISLNGRVKYVAGLVAKMGGEDSTIKNSFFNGDIVGRTAYVAGIVGDFGGQEIYDTYSTANILVNNPTPNAYIGGLVGYADHANTDLQRVHVEGNISIVNGLADYVGGLVGYLNGGSLMNCYAVGDITGARTSVGGVIGLSKGDMQYCYSGGDVNASFRHAGGLVGHQLGGSVGDSFTDSDVFSGKEAGGAIGFANVNPNQIFHVYAYNTVTKTNPIGLDNFFGPIVGNEINSGSIMTSYHLDTNINPAFNTLGVALSEAQAADPLSYDGYNFSAVNSWRVPDPGFKLPGSAVDYTYPILEWLGSGSSVQSYMVGGTVTGLNFSKVTLNLNGVEDLVINENDTTFTFLTALIPGQTYNITVTTPAIPTGVDCILSNDNGNMGSADVLNVLLDCPSLVAVSSNPKTLVIGNGENYNFTALGTLSNNIEIDITDRVSWSSNITSVGTVNSVGAFSTVANGFTTLTAEVIGLSDTSAVAVYDPINAATNLVWSETSPHDGLVVTASWNKSNSVNLLNQTIKFYSNNSCAGTEVATFIENNSVTTRSFSAENNTSYSYTVASKSSDGVIKQSSCSSSLDIILLKPEGVSSIASSSVWISGSEPLNSPIVSWINPSAVAIDYVEVGLGSSFNVTDTISPVAVGENNSHIFQNISGLTECSPYFPVAFVVDDNGIKSDPVTDTIGFRWDNTAPPQIASLSSVGDATETATAEFSWSAPSDNCAVRFYEMAIGTSNSTQDIASFKPIGNVTTYTAVSGAQGFILNMTPGQDYYTFVRAVDYAGNRAVAQVSSPWQIVELDNNLPDFILWLDSADKSSLVDTNGALATDPAFINNVKTWTDISGSAVDHSFVATNNTEAPDFVSDKIFFNGTDHFFTTPNHAEINLDTVIEKNITLAIKTENNINARQVIYEEGGTVRGMNIYIDNGKLHCGFWNVNDDGDGAQAYTGVSTDILANKTYHVSWVFDYSNYSGASGPDGDLKCYVNNNLIGTSSSTTRIFPHSGAIGIGGMDNDTYFFDGSSSGDGHLFRGNILEVMITNVSVTEAVIETLHNYLIGKWSEEESSKPSAVTINNIATTSQSAIVAWQPIDPVLFDTSSYEIALGTTPGGTELVFWMDIGNVTSYQFVDGVDSVAMTLSEGLDYYVSIRAVGTFGNLSDVASSEPWAIFNFTNDVQGIVLRYDLADLSSVEDENGVDANNGAFTGNVNKLYDLSSSTINHDSINSGTLLPTFSVVNNELIFDGANNLIEIPNSDEINLTNTFAEKNITMTFTTSGSNTARQVLYEEGGGSRGMNLYIEGDKLYCGFWNVPNDGDGAQDFISVSKTINTSTDYVVTWRFDYSNYSGAEGADGRLDCFLNTEYMGSANTTSRVFPHGGKIGLGGIKDNSRFHTGSTGTAISHFDGAIRDVIINNTTMRADKVQGLQNFLGF